jgi:alkylated DNA repair dioxygenase AlkB
MEVLKSALVVAPEEFEEAWGLWDTLPWTPNPMNKKYNIKRKQATFGGTYRFAGQVSHEVNVWPRLVTRVLDFTREHSGTVDYNVVHANWYPDGTAGLEPHADDMRKNLPGRAIYSFTFLSEPGNPRGFQVYRDGVQVEEHMLDHGDLVIMSAAMQTTHKHGIKKSSAKKFQNLKRLNLTVRAWRIA